MQTFKNFQDLQIALAQQNESGGKNLIRRFLCLSCRNHVVTEDDLFWDHWVGVLQSQVQLLFPQKCLVYPFSFLKGHF